VLTLAALVKLPGLLVHTDLSERGAHHVLQGLASFLRFLQKNASTMFPAHGYIDAG
jgi:hypothetical protein